MQRLLNFIDLLLDLFTLGEYGLGYDEVVEYGTVDESDWSDWEWPADWRWPS